MNIEARDFPLSPSSGFSCFFKISSIDSSSNVFELSLSPKVNACTYILSAPSSMTLNGNQKAILKIQGVDIDYSNPSNSIVFTINSFGANSGDPIKIKFNGVYYDNLNNSHTILGDIDIVKT